MASNAQAEEVSKLEEQSSEMRQKMETLEDEADAWFTADSIGKMWLLLVISGLTSLWCVLDSWNHEMNEQLFHFGQITSVKPKISNDGLEQAEVLIKPFNYTLTLVFLQFAFMAGFFLFLSALQNSLSNNPKVQVPNLLDGRWSALVSTHVFSSVLLQSLMMPTQMLSLAAFAASRAIEVPWAAGMRAYTFKSRFGGHPLSTTALMCLAAWVLFYSYTQISECMCVWTGFGVALTGPALYFTYLLLITLPASNAVLQEAVLVQLQANPLWILALNNIGACIVFAPILFAAHYFGYEDVTSAVHAIAGNPRIYLTVLWLCVQMAILAAVELAMICLVDSFWAVAMRSMRVVYWWARQIMVLYVLNGGTLVSVVRPNASFWSLMMLCGLAFAIGAVVTDERSNAAEEDAERRKEKRPVLEGGLNMKYGAP